MIEAISFLASSCSSVSSFPFIRSRQIVRPMPVRAQMRNAKSLSGVGADAVATSGVTSWVASGVTSGVAVFLAMVFGDAGGIEKGN